ncbi:hypothetical protein Aca07nite_15470 [Actinoplanes capillaceus]|uniref:Uncharacterized protein n=1 Tax=Actinoplanes campanulatus TaxID=113559 RepID=A0ABQ3WBA1_9ACTN|nr:hypothetical protein Aca07nite_15470 [Actinoplanes capillaceus]
MAAWIAAAPGAPRGREADEFGEVRVPGVAVALLFIVTAVRGSPVGSVISFGRPVADFRQPLPQRPKLSRIAAPLETGCWRRDQGFRRYSPDMRIAPLVSIRCDITQRPRGRGG